ncbi:MAG: cation:dicarboxylase symporter family transporter [Sphingomonas sp.]|jgi:Na+/H+-dicarboxylate symporter
MSQTIRIFLSLIFCLALGILVSAQMPAWAPLALAIAEPIGAAWLHGLQMTVVPLVVALLVVGVATTANAARAGRLAGASMAAFVVLLWLATIMSAIVTPLILRQWPLAPDAAAALKNALSHSAPVGQVPPFGEFLAAIVPPNAISAAANDAFLPLIVFTLALAFAITRLPDAQRLLLTNLFQALAEAMLIVIGWVLWLAPLGVGALAFVIGAKVGTAAFGALLHYVLVVSSVGLIVWLSAFPLGVVGGRVGLGRFVRAALPAQSVAISTQSSLASLPAMVQGATALGVPEHRSGITLPLAVAIFRATSPAMNLAVAIYIATWFGITLTPAALCAGVAVAAITTMGSVSLPGSISYISSIAPIAAAMGVPIAPLGLLVAIEAFPDIMRTVGNVTMDLAVTATLSARARDADK